MHHYSQGKPTQHAHKGIPEGHFEEEQGLKGFFGPVSHLIRKKPSTRWSEIDGPLKPRMYDPVEMSCQGGWKRLMHNSDVAIYLQDLSVDASQMESAFRNADGDTLYFCHEGSGEVYTEYGLLNYKKGQYILVPKCVTHAFVVKEKTRLLIVENKTSHYMEPDRGMVGRHAVYDTQSFHKPDLDKMNGQLNSPQKEFVNVVVKHLDSSTVFKYDECVFDVVGWKGDLFPFVLDMKDLMPLMSHRAHLPPSAHTTFVGAGFVVCSFVPRPLETDKDALKVPFYHQNIDYDEVIFYHDGDFFSRDNLHPGMISFHPAGFPHGPHPKAIKGIDGKTHTDEYAVMIDTRRPLFRDDVLTSVELQDYWKSWQG